MAKFLKNVLRNIKGRGGTCLGGPYFVQSQKQKHQNYFSNVAQIL